MMSSEAKGLKVDKALFLKKATQVTEADIEKIASQTDEIEKKFLSGGPFGTFVEELLLSLKLIKDYAIGAYRKVPYWAIGSIALMIFYVLNPVDLVPDFIIGIGQIDDFAVITLCLALVRQEIHTYKGWREENPQDEDEAVQD